MLITTNDLFIKYFVLYLNGEFDSIKKKNTESHLVLSLTGGEHLSSALCTQLLPYLRPRE